MPGLNGHAYSIPAQDCFFNVMGAPADGSGSVLSFNAAACYGSGSSTSRCDLNGDGSTNAVDLQTLVNAILAASTSSVYDINKDTLVNVLDAQVLTNVILGKASCP